ncbi:MAG: hypothetical protein E4H23_05490 [Chrysiogenales bacterium]|nr:MAG: hypothetical protein E4H23_05490 [Chrysiogenales bacterium]
MARFWTFIFIESFRFPFMKDILPYSLVDDNTQVMKIVIAAANENEIRSLGGWNSILSPANQCAPTQASSRRRRRNGRIGMDEDEGRRSDSQKRFMAVAA